MEDIVIVAATRTAVGKFGGSLAKVAAPDLGAIVIKNLLERTGVAADQIGEVILGQVLAAGSGQNPARQSLMKSGVAQETPALTINAVCGSGLKAVMLAAQAVAWGDSEIVIAGGQENMTLAPHLLETSRSGYRMGPTQMTDSMIKDGLWDPYNNFHMGNAAEICVKEHNFTREEQDAFAIQSYERSANAWEAGKFDNEIVPVAVPQRKGEPVIVSKDEEYTNVKLDRISSLNPAFTKEGTVTAANASTINDGAAALVIMSEKKAKALGLSPLAYILSYADAAQEPKWFTTSPALALPKALKKANLTIEDVDYFEFNEAFSVVGLANAKILNIDQNKINVNGGAVSLGHPLGCSGARIIVTLINVLKQNNATLGAAGICNGGGGASAMVVELVG